MKSIQDLVSDLPAWTLWAAPVTGLIAAMLAYYIGARVFDAFRHLVGLFLPPSWRPTPPAKDELDFGMNMSRRNSVRRRGNEVGVVVRKPGSADTTPGRVVDRSRTGLCLRVPMEIPRGARLEVQAADNAVESWVQVDVRRSMEKGGEWELGCQFPTQPPDDVLEQFG